MFLKEVRFYQEELLETVQNIKELLLLQSREHVILQ